MWQILIVQIVDAEIHEFEINEYFYLKTNSPCDVLRCG